MSLCQWQPDTHPSKKEREKKDLSLELVEEEEDVVVALAEVRVEDGMMTKMISFFPLNVIKNQSH